MMLNPAHAPTTAYLMLVAPWSRAAARSSAEITISPEPCGPPPVPDIPTHRHPDRAG